MMLFFFILSNFKKNDVKIRKEIRDLTPEEWQTFKSAVLNLKEHGMFEDLAELHKNADAYAHNNPRFLPWHRALLLYFESLLQLINNNPSLTVPYWDWTIDSDDPQSSLIFKERFWGFNDCFEMHFPEKHCLKRSKEIDPFYNKIQINKLINKKMSYDEFRESLELVPHAVVHFNVGGKDGDMSMMYSTNDPLFWHHHSYIDYLWHKKQEKNLKNKYGGKDSDINEVLKPFGKTIKEILDLNDCNIKYKEYVPVKIMSLEMKPGKISEEYAKRHGYDINKIRKIEDFLTNDKPKLNWFIRLIKFIFCIR